MFNSFEVKSTLKIEQDRGQQMQSQVVGATLCRVF